MTGPKSQKHGAVPESERTEGAGREKAHAARAAARARHLRACAGPRTWARLAQTPPEEIEDPAAPPGLPRRKRQVASACGTGVRGMQVQHLPDMLDWVASADKKRPPRRPRVTCVEECDRGRPQLRGSSRTAAWSGVSGGSSSPSASDAQRECVCGGRAAALCSPRDGISGEKSPIISPRYGDDSEAVLRGTLAPRCEPGVCGVGDGDAWFHGELSASEA